jgi:DNA-directed RNA polymerase specialized sigma24 family protein
MTMSATPSPISWRPELGEASIRRQVASMVRRRVPAHEAEDVTQTVLCDALAAERIPAEPEELRRFVAGIARHKVADFHRRARRSPSVGPESEPPEVMVPPPPVEARALLASVAASVDDRERETFGWLVREHAGEQLGAIADEVGLPAPAVRQRVSRLRRALRERWAHALAFVIVLGAFGAAAHEAARAPRVDGAIVADPIGAPKDRAIGLAHGPWRVEDARTPSGAPMALARTIRIEIARASVDITTPTGTITRRIERVRPSSDGGFDLDLVSDAGAVQHATARLDDRGGLSVTLHDGRFRGTARLVR